MLTKEKAGQTCTGNNHNSKVIKLPLKQHPDKFSTKNEVATFWSITKKNTILFDSHLFIKYLENFGFRTVKIGDVIELVEIKGNIVNRVTPSDIKQFVLKQFADDTEILKYLIDRTGLWSLNYLDALSVVTLKMHRDTKEASYHYFKNGVVKVSKKGIEPPIPYLEFKHLIWGEHIINHDFDLSVSSDAIFAKFISRLANNTDERILQIRSTIGYCLHNYRDPSNTRAVILNDENISDIPEGGSGKGLLVQAMSHLRKTYTFDGKKFDPKNQFSYQNIDETITIIHIDDPARGFNFEDLFSVITSGIPVNRKKIAEYYLPIEKCPIFILTTNTILKGAGSSNIRRQYNIDIHQHFNAYHRPIDEFKQNFFSQWDSTEWNKFYRYFLESIQIYLDKGVIECSEQEGAKKEAIRLTNNSFVDWFEDVKEDFKCWDTTPTTEAKEQFLRESGQKFKISLSDKKFLTWVKAYCRIFKIEFTKNDGRPRGFKIGNEQEVF
jgi:hypothetical protein